MTLDYHPAQISSSSIDMATSPVRWDQPEWSITELMELKQKCSVAVVIPALNEAATIGGVITSVRPLLDTLVDEIWVIDSGSSDATIQQALLAGARVVTREEALPDIAPRAGKGEVLWRSLGVVNSDIIAFIDADLIDPDPLFIPKLIGPLLIEENLALVKAFYRRPLLDPNSQANREEMRSGGGRLTELLVRPLIAALRPELSAIIQPLSGEFAARREHLMRIPFAPGYGVDIGILCDMWDLCGQSAIGQVNLGVRSHRNRPVQELGRMGRQVVSALLSRCGVRDSGAPLIQFIEENSQFSPQEFEIVMEDRPPFQQICRSYDMR